MSLSINSTLTLRLYYGAGNSALTKKAARSEATCGTLSFADSTALRTAIRRLKDYKWEEVDDKSAQERLMAFTDTVNATIDSSSHYGTNDSSVKNALKEIKNLNKKHADELKDIGITVKSDGTLSLSSSAAENLSHSKFKEFFGNDSSYLNSLYSAAKKINRKVDIRL
ncbi:MAG: hypothetical protein K5773_04140 [Pseudobutyrivibrio sp.]|nr:hypothetical protein [Pseudobutyrivibrio sp.]